MGVRVININEYRKQNRFSKKLFNGSNGDSEGSDVVVEAPIVKYRSGVNYESLVAFIIEFGVKVKEDDSEIYTKLMRKYHKCIVFYGVKYYLQNKNMDDKNQLVYNYLVDNYADTSY